MNHLKEDFERKFAKPRNMLLRRVISDERYESMETELAFQAWCECSADRNKREGGQERKTWATDGGRKCLNCDKSLIDHAEQRYCPTASTPPADAKASVSAGLSKQEILDIAAKVAYLSNTAPDESIIEFARALESRLAKAAVVPEGWVAVPKEPSDEILLAMVRTVSPAFFRDGLRKETDGPHTRKQVEALITSARKQYDAAIAAAPSIEVQVKPMPGQGEG